MGGFKTMHRIQEDISEASVIFGVKQVCLFNDDVKFNFERETKFLPGPDRRSDEGQDLLFLLSHDQGASGQHGPPRRNAWEKRPVGCLHNRLIEILLLLGVSIMRRWTMQVESESLPLVRSPLQSFCVLF